MSKFNWNDIKEEIIDLKVNKGYGSRKIQKHIADKHNHNVSSSAVRNTLKRWGYGGNTFEKKLQENEFSIPENWSYGWLKTKEASVFVRNQEEIMTLDDVTNVIKDAVKNIKQIKLPKVSKTNKKALRAVISDCHVGMKSDGKEAMFSFEYNENIFNEHLGLLFQSISDKIDAHGDFDLIIIDDLGDGLDGFNGETTRGGHKLPQNMDNKDAWEAYVFGKIETYANIVKLNAAKKYQFRNVTNCNHCFTQDTEVMTNNGWKLYSELTRQDLVASVDLDTDEINFYRPIDYIFNEDVACEINTYKNKNVDLSVTTEHRMLNRKSSIYNDEYRYDLSRDMSNRGQSYFKVSGKNYKEDYNGVTDDEIRFAAWILTDGSITKYNNNPTGFCIYQSKESTKEIIRNLLNDMNISFRESVYEREVNTVCGRELVSKPKKQTAFVINKTQSEENDLYRLLSVINTKDKFPEWMGKLSKRQFDVFLNEYILGDGSRKLGVDTSATVYGTEKNLSQLQYFCVLNSHKANLSINNRGDYILTIVFDKEEVSIKPKKHMNSSYYEGYTWCLTMPKSNLVVRRNGRVSIQGNSGDFGWTANMAIKMSLEQMFDNVEYILLDKPIEHFFYGEHCHLLTHGKDKSLMVRNWSLQLTDKIANLIRQYIDHHDIRSKYIHLDKGDLHSLGYAREPKFDYRNFMSFAPPSQWVQANFGVSYCGFSLQVIPKNSNQIEHTDIFFDMKRI